VCCIGFIVYKLCIRKKYILGFKMYYYVALYGFDVCEGKVTPLQSWTGPEGSRRLRLQEFKIVET
jgi:hypothetical protein